MLDVFRCENIFDNDHSSDGNDYDKDDAGNDEEKGVIMTRLLYTELMLDAFRCENISIETFCALFKGVGQGNVPH